jgi:glutathione peroxidase-family protein
MKYLIYLSVVFLNILNASAQSSIYDTSRTITSLMGNTVTLNQFSGKKMVVLILPFSQTANNITYIKKLDSVCGLYASKITVIGVLSYESGFNDSSLTTLRNWFSTVQLNNLVITQGMHTNKSSGTLQNDLFTWLTNSNLNGHFSNDVAGINDKFFLNEQGQLFGRFGPDMRMSVKALQKLLQ